MSALYPVARSPRAWASATPFELLEASPGLEFDLSKGEIRLHNPRLPAFLEEVTLRNPRLDLASVDLRFRRDTDAVSLDILRTRGQIQVSVVCSPREVLIANGDTLPIPSMELRCSLRLGDLGIRLFSEPKCARIIQRLRGWRRLP